MLPRHAEVVVVGAGQAGVAMSEHLMAAGIEHVVLEKDRIASSWRTRRWDSLVANGPAWHDRFPGLAYELDDDVFPGKERVADYFAAYAEKFAMPVHTGVEVTGVEKLRGQRGFRVVASTAEEVSEIHTHYVVSATGAFQSPVVPPVVPGDAGLVQLHSADYRNPDQLPAGGVLVVGGGASGVQIAAELRAAGRPTWLAVSAHDRPPRRYRGRDNVWWLGVLGKWDAATPPEGAEHVTFAVSGAHGGHTVDFRALAAQGITLTGRVSSYDAGGARGTLHFADDLAANLAHGDANYLAVLDEADAWVEANGLDLPEEPSARDRLPDPECITDPVRELDIAAAGITSIVWATGYTNRFDWLQVDAFDEAGRPRHQRGVSVVPGLYFLGLPWLSRRGSTFIWGVWHDAKHLADQIAIQRSYFTYGSHS